MKQRLTTFGLGPLLLAQGLYVRRVTPRLPEPAGPRAGEAGAGAPLRLLITGDSAAAGVGAPTQDEALAGRLVEALAVHFRISWRLVARTGNTTAQTLAELATLPAEPFDVVVTSLGVNDVTGGVGMSRWLAQQRALVDMLRGKFAARQVLLSALPPMHLFPALPQPLRWYLGGRAARFNQLLGEWAPQQEGCRLVTADFAPDPGVMAADGFHPGPEAYAVWGRRLAAEIAASRHQGVTGVPHGV